MVVISRHASTFWSRNSVSITISSKTIFSWSLLMLHNSRNRSWYCRLPWSRALSDLLESTLWHINITNRLRALPVWYGITKQFTHPKRYWSLTSDRNSTFSGLVYANHSLLTYQSLYLIVVYEYVYNSWSLGGATNRSVHVASGDRSGLTHFRVILSSAAPPGGISTH
jgi:hypothetical protein